MQIFHTAPNTPFSQIATHVIQHACHELKTAPPNSTITFFTDDPRWNHTAAQWLEIWNEPNNYLPLKNVIIKYIDLTQIMHYTLNLVLMLEKDIFILFAPQKTTSIANIHCFLAYAKTANRPVLAYLQTDDSDVAKKRHNSLSVALFLLGCRQTWFNTTLHSSSSIDPHQLVAQQQ